MFAERGYAATSMREVAEAASCTKPALYYYFQSKSALFLELIRGHDEHIRGLLAAALGAGGDVRTRLLRAGHGYLSFVRACPTALRLLVRAELGPERGQPVFDFKSARRHYLAMVRELVAEGVARGEIRAIDDVDDVVFALTGSFDTRINLWLLEGTPIPDDYPERMLALLFGGLAP